MATARNDRTYVRRRDALKKRARAADSPCHLCGGPIDWDADYRDKRAFTADHVMAVGAGGSMHGELLPAHRSCNSRRGKKQLDVYVDSRPERIAPTTWW